MYSREEELFPQPDKVFPRKEELFSQSNKNSAREGELFSQEEELFPREGTLLSREERLLFPGKHFPVARKDLFLLRKRFPNSGSQTFPRGAFFRPRERFGNSCVLLFQESGRQTNPQGKRIATASLIIADALGPLEPILNALNSYSTRGLRQAGVPGKNVKPWARRGSTIYLWKERDVAKGIEYVVLKQGEELFSLDDD